MSESKSDKQFKHISCDSVEAKCFRLIDDDGNMRASFSCAATRDGKQGHTVVHLYDGKGAPKISLQVDDDDGQNITLFNSNSNSAAFAISSNIDRGNGLTITNPNGHPLITIGVHGPVSDNEDGVSEITVSDESQLNVWSVVNGKDVNSKPTST